MKGLTKLQLAGVILIIGSLLFGLGGTAWSVYGSFAALETAENTGIGPVGDHIRNALIFTVAGLVGAVSGVLIIIFGRRR
ncbi:MAG TPA: MotA/TolQ/ExbB proton channel family protein [Pyrinomonadaceae bacterium]|nr:MotA/TolQ/ExbB proton channel family protein [Pyrinomonadaceae bacterium]